MGGWRCRGPVRVPLGRPIRSSAVPWHDPLLFGVGRHVVYGTAERSRGLLCHLLSW